MTNHIYVIESKDPETGRWGSDLEFVFKLKKHADQSRRELSDYWNNKYQFRVVKYTREEAR